MKYIITESKINGLIERYILKKYSKVKDVTFKNKKVMLGSDRKIIDSTTIVVTLDNSDNKMTQIELSDLRKEIINDVDQVFGLDWQEYGSPWGFMFRQLALVNITATLVDTNYI